MRGRLAFLSPETWKEPLLYFVYGGVGAAFFYKFVDWVVYEGGAFRFKLHKTRLEPKEERYLEPVFAGPKEGFYWPSKLDETNIESVLQRRLELSKGSMERARKRANLPSFELDRTLCLVENDALGTDKPDSSGVHDETLGQPRALLRVLQERTKNYIAKRGARE